MTEKPDVSLEIADGFARLVLNRPETGNALSMKVAQSLHAIAVDLQRRDDLRAIVLSANGRLFCAGGDVREMASAVDRESFLADLAGEMHAALLALRALPVVILAAVQGPTAGGGLGLVLAADIVVASETASFVAAYSSIGLSPDCGMTALLPAALGPRRAALFALTNPTLSAADALEWGLVTQVCAPEKLAQTVDNLAGTVAARPGSSAGQTALLLRQGAERDYADQLAAEVTSISRLSVTPAASELIERFANR